MTGRILTNIVAAGVAGLALAWGAPAQAQEFGSPELIAAAKAEGKLVFYTANFAEVEQQVIKAFNKRFPEIKVEMVRAPGGQLITRVKTEAAAGKLIADVVDPSDRALTRGQRTARLQPQIRVVVQAEPREGGKTRIEVAEFAAVDARLQHRFDTAPRTHAGERGTARPVPRSTRGTRAGTPTHGRGSG